MTSARPSEDDYAATVRALSNDHLTVELTGPVLTATLCRSDAGNGIDRVLADSLAAWADQAVQGARAGVVRVAVLRNTGFGFCVGGDLKHFSGAENLPAELAYVVRTIHGAIEVLTQAPLPVITVVDGVAAGGGVGLALVGDIVIGTPATRFKMSYTSVGLSPDCGGSWLLTHRVGLGRALEMTLSDRTIGAEEAERIGLVGPLCTSHDELPALLGALVDRLSGMSADALATSKLLIRTSAMAQFGDHLADEEHHIVRLSATTDGAQGVQAFAQRRRTPATGA